MFKQPQKPRLFQDLVEQIETAIFDGRLRVGDRLPSQREMVEMFQTSRATLREALRVLELKGLIDVRLGVSGGAVVKKVGTEPVTESLALLLRQREVGLAELAEFRQGVEGIAASLSADRATDKDLAGMKVLVDRARSCLEKGVSAWRQFSDMDNQIHLAIARSCGNAVYRFILEMVHGNIHSYFEAHPLDDYVVMQENYRDLEEIVSAISRRQATAAKALMQSHVRRFNRYMVQSGMDREKKPSAKEAS